MKYTFKRSIEIIIPFGIFSNNFLPFPSKVTRWPLGTRCKSGLNVAMGSLEEEQGSSGCVCAVVRVTCAKAPPPRQWHSNRTNCKSPPPTSYYSWVLLKSSVTNFKHIIQPTDFYFCAPLNQCASFANSLHVRSVIGPLTQQHL